MALEAIKGIKTVQETANEFEMHLTQIAAWKKTMCGDRGFGNTDMQRDLAEYLFSAPQD